MTGSGGFPPPPARCAPRAVVNTAGLYGDIVDARLGLEPEFEIRPRKGQFVVLDKAAAAHVPRIVLPVPTEITKGVVVCPTAFGNVLVGPTAEEQDDRVRATVEKHTLEALLARGAEIVPALAGIRSPPSMPACARRARARPIASSAGRRAAPSPSAASAPPAQRRARPGAARASADRGFRPRPRAGGKRAGRCNLPNLTETLPRDWQQPGHGEIVCHCELATKREIEGSARLRCAAGRFRRAVRRRTRAGMGRCQGFYCNARLADMTRGHLAEPLAVGGDAS